ncbi:MAG TPA: response regulator [Chloroflexota bacterium]|nr:response regulator [Chloroflexota bacterium]
MPDQAVPPAIRVLLVEDNPADARLIVEAVREAHEGEIALTRVSCLTEARNSLQTAAWDVILLDLTLPDSSSLHTFSHTFDQAGDVPIVVLTGIADEGLAMEAMRRGAADYLQKGESDTPGILRAVRYAAARASFLRILQAERDERAELEGALFTARAAAHTLNNHLAITVGFAELLALDTTLPSHARERAGSILDGAMAAAETLKRLQRIVHLDEVAQMSLPVG